MWRKRSRTSYPENERHASSIRINPVVRSHRILALHSVGHIVIRDFSNEIQERNDAGNVLVDENENRHEGRAGPSLRFHHA